VDTSGKSVDVTYVLSSNFYFTVVAIVLTTDLYKYSIPDDVPPIHAVSANVTTDKGPSKFRSILATIYNQSQLAERKHAVHYWSISAVPVSAHPLY